ncbi:NADH dehydrogenase [ubiquinone] 1 beta subcomplex subunit 1-like [Anguilla rostrata]|uniref:NADH dehydrogenase [ubiquinone] 1 beta subcomplex subunit 1-like n=1 Tax=Anguilla anguilla TaxID=7936 RepID=UPI0015AF1C91|nr:NADH dehydrogenase [ubiquinone] 1 beta subcomplex subunit 1-like [Anguilla anguilla]
MVNIGSILKTHWVSVLVPLGFVIGVYLDRVNDGKLAAFRNKSVLYSRELKPGEVVTWK